MAEKAAEKITAEKPASKAMAPSRVGSPASNLKPKKAVKKKTTKKKPKTAKKIVKNDLILAKKTKQERNLFYQDLMCAAVASSEKGLKRLCEEFKATDKEFPSHMQFIRWNLEDESFRSRYAHAKEQQADVIADQILEISDDSSLDEIFTDEGKRLLNSEFVQRSKLRVDARKWVAAKLRPKKYGDKITQEHTGPNGDAITLLLAQIDGTTKDMVKA